MLTYTLREKHKRRLKAKEDKKFAKMQKVNLAKLNRKFRKEKKREKTKKYLYELVAYVKNNEHYSSLKGFATDFFLTVIAISLVVWSFKHRNSLVLGFGIAVTITLAQDYIEWWYEVRKKYR